MTEPADAIRVHQGASFTELSDPKQQGWMSWRSGRDGEHFRRCPHCGSLHPEDMAEAVRAGSKLELADMKYGWPHKFYLDVPNRNPDRRVIVSTTNAAVPEGEGWVKVRPWHHWRLKREGWGGWPEHRGHHLRFGTRPNHYGKFYTVHLCDDWVPQEIRDLVQERTGIKIEPAPDGRVKWSYAPPTPA